MSRRRSGIYEPMCWSDVLAPDRHTETWSATQILPFSWWSLFDILGKPFSYREYLSHRYISAKFAKVLPKVPLRIGAIDGKTAMWTFLACDVARITEMSLGRGPPRVGCYCALIWNFDTRLWGRCTYSHELSKLLPYLPITKPSLGNLCARIKGGAAAISVIQLLVIVV